MSRADAGVAHGALDAARREMEHALRRAVPRVEGGADVVEVPDVPLRMREMGLPERLVALQEHPGMLHGLPKQIRQGRVGVVEMEGLRAPLLLRRRSSQPCRRGTPPGAACGRASIAG